MATTLEVSPSDTDTDQGHSNGPASNTRKSVEHTQAPIHPTRSLQFLQRLNSDTNSTEPPPLQAKVKLRVIIVGAGLGGLSCAIALARRGHTITVLEQASQLGEVDLQDCTWGCLGH